MGSWGTAQGLRKEEAVNFDGDWGLGGIPLYGSSREERAIVSPQSSLQRKPSQKIYTVTNINKHFTFSFQHRHCYSLQQLLRLLHSLCNSLPARRRPLEPSWRSTEDSSPSRPISPSTGDVSLSLTLLAVKLVKLMECLARYQQVSSRFLG